MFRLFPFGLTPRTDAKQPKCKFSETGTLKESYRHQTPTRVYFRFREVFSLLLFCRGLFIMRSQVRIRWYANILSPWVKIRAESFSLHFVLCTKRFCRSTDNVTETSWSDSAWQASLHLHKYCMVTHFVESFMFALFWLRELSTCLSENC